VNPHELELKREILLNFETEKKHIVLSSDV
jgi:hypothetical protein